MFGKYDVPPGSDKCLPSDAVAQWDGGGRLGGLGWVGSKVLSRKKWGKVLRKVLKKLLKKC